jgi:hypothetical protein
MPGHCTGADSQSAGQGLTPGHWAEWAVLGVSEQATLGLRLWLWEVVAPLWWQGQEVGTAFLSLQDMRILKLMMSQTTQAGLH